MLKYKEIKLTVNKCRAGELYTYVRLFFIVSMALSIKKMGKVTKVVRKSHTLKEIDAKSLFDGL